MSKTIIGHTKSDRPPLIEKIKVLQLVEAQIKRQNKQAQKILTRGLNLGVSDYLEEDEPGDNAMDSEHYAISLAIITELKSIHNKIAKL